MSVRFNYSGRKIFALQRKKGPVIYDIDKPKAGLEFNQYGYKNTCTMKSACFAGDSDQVCCIKWKILQHLFVDFLSSSYEKEARNRQFLVDVLSIANADRIHYWRSHRRNHYLTNLVSYFLLKVWLQSPPVNLKEWLSSSILVIVNSHLPSRLWSVFKVLSWLIAFS